MNFLLSLNKYKEHREKSKALFLLRTKPERILIDCNISPELLEKGVSAWPWKLVPDEVTTQAEVVQGTVQQQDTTLVKENRYASSTFLQPQKAAA